MESPATKSRATFRQLAGVPRSSQPLVLAELLSGKFAAPESKAPSLLVHVAVGDRAMEQLAATLPFFAGDAEILRLPAWDCLPYDRASPLAAIMAERMRTLSSLATASKKPRIVLTTANALLQRLPPREAMKNIFFTLEKGGNLERDALVSFLVSQGYRRVGKAMEPGEFALRGGIIDIIPSGMTEGMRIDLFGDEIESIRSFDPLSQLTQNDVERFTLYPVSEVLLTADAIERFRENYREQFGANVHSDPLYEAISSGQSYVGMEHWLSLFYAKTETLLDYAEGALFTFDSEVEKAISERQETILDYYGAREQALKTRSNKNSFASGETYHPVQPDNCFIMQASWELLAGRADPLVLSPFNAETNTGRFDSAAYRQVLRFTQGNSENTPFDQLRSQAESAATRGKNTLVACYSDGSRDRLFTLLSERGFHCILLESWVDAKDVRGKSIGLATLPLDSGFETDKSLFFSEQDVLGERIIRATKKKKSDVFMQEAASFAAGELVVHKDHGIGRFEGLVTVEVSGAAHDCLKIIYEGDDKLFLPVENIELVSRFGLEEEDVKLDKLGGASWQNRKALLKKRISIAAEALLKIAAERQVRAGTVIEAPTGTYDDFSARFGYMETDDQARSIGEVLEDLHSGRPMDSLVCGDVGFGKTEVALRAAFVAAMSPENPVQVAVIAPTTLLARQHFKNFTERFSGFPVKVRQLSRMVSAKDQKTTRDGLKDGSVNIVVGTHALLSKQVEFKNLGLVNVDEGQHFGVAQKERLKEMRANVHVLTLSATPIPRTLQMALTGVRDLSLITTPPVDRLAVRSFVMPFDPVVLREAILREQHRGGKTFVVTPRIKYMAELHVQLQQLVPEIKIAIIHGQMPPGDIDTLMNDFYDGKYDLLLSTAIIESGLDIPTANTMIVHHAHLFGLAQLYQLRGRVGRGKTRAYAYFLLPPYKELTKQATRRLEVMQTLDTLGAGFTLASHDMDIRGFGNLVGEEQSGHIKEVGIELYQQMLEEAVRSLQSAGSSKDSLQTENRELLTDWSPQINLGISVMIPETYVSDLGLRLGLYRRVAGLENEADINQFAAELTDRFGAYPEEVAHLIAVLSLKQQCKACGIDRLDIGPKGAVISFRNNLFAKPEALLEHIAKHPRTLKLRPDQKLVFTHEWKNAEDKISTLKRLLEQVEKLAQ